MPATPPPAALRVRHLLEPLLVSLATPLVGLPRHLQRTALSSLPRRPPPSSALPSRPSIPPGAVLLRRPLHRLRPWLLPPLRLLLPGVLSQCAGHPASARRARASPRQTVSSAARWTRWSSCPPCWLAGFPSSSGWHPLSRKYPVHIGLRAAISRYPPRCALRKPPAAWSSGPASVPGDCPA